MAWNVDYGNNALQRALLRVYFALQGEYREEKEMEEELDGQGVKKEKLKKRRSKKRGGTVAKALHGKQFPTLH